MGYGFEALADGYDEGFWDGGNVDPGARKVLGLEAFVMGSSGGRLGLADRSRVGAEIRGISLLMRGGCG